MPRKDDEETYDKTNRESVLRHAGKLTGRTLTEVGVIDVGSNPGTAHTKGYFGQELERSYFLLSNNNIPEPDFKELGIELKSTPMKEGSKGCASKERLILGIIDYMAIEELGFDGSFMKKNKDLLIVFYLYKPNTPYTKYKVIKVVEWRFPEEDLDIIHDDWNKIMGMVAEGRAHELSERYTQFMGPAPKGAGGEKDLRSQPKNKIKARQRAFALKNSYVNKIFRESTNQIFPGVFTNQMVADSYMEPSMLSNWKWTEGTYEDHVRNSYGRFSGMTCRAIEEKLGIELNDKAKNYFAALAVAMATGSAGSKHVQEFVDADIQMKTVRVDAHDNVKESMSFPAIKYMDIVDSTWEESPFYDALNKRFLFICIRQDNKEHRKEAVFLGAFFWSIPEADMREAEKVWTTTRDLVRAGDYDSFPKISDNRVSHVRPHGRDSTDTYPGPDGKQHGKKCFWLNASYIKSVLIESGILNGDKKQ